MARETIASVREEMGALLADAQERADRHAAAYADAAAVLRKEQAEHEATRQANEKLRAENQHVRGQLEMLRGYIEAKVPIEERENVSGRMALALEGDDALSNIWHRSL